MHWGVSALATAARGDRLPTWEVTEGFVRALDGDVAVWRRRWEAAHRRAHGLAAEPGDLESVDQPAPAAPVAPAAAPAALVTQGGPAGRGGPRPSAARTDAGPAAQDAALALWPPLDVRNDEEHRNDKGQANGNDGNNDDGNSDDRAGARRAPAGARAPRRLYWVLAALTLLVVFAATATVGLVGKSVGDEGGDARIASAEAARQSDLIRAGDPALALRLGLAAYTLAPTAEARGALWSGAAAAYPTPLPGGLGASVGSISSSADGGTVVAADRGGTVARIWRVPDQGRPTLASELRLGARAPAVFSPVGHLLAAAGPDRTVYLYDVSRPDHPTPVSALVTDVDTVDSMAFSPDGRTLAVTVGRDRTIRLLDISDQSRPAIAGVLTAADGTDFSIVAFSRDGRTIATADSAGQVELWAVTDRRRPRLTATLPAHGTTTALAFSPSGPVLAVTGERTCELWDTTDPAHPVRKLRWSAVTGQTDLDVVTAMVLRMDLPRARRGAPRLGLEHDRGFCPLGVAISPCLRPAPEGTIRDHAWGADVAGVR
ncbi:WD40 repeat domain-containing protein [Pseudofrankia asymbiotica]|uniref:WD40 repeat domain-containing protein n=1 Tax=Pseudofrankia asymbiotica TaxID=1834516 RepID=UPI0013047BEB|nr:hypothetical protein [Pseudofrankia asymbiotica]